MNTAPISSLTDEQLIEQYHEAARAVSVCNAAEGDSWFRERDRRERVNYEYRIILAELIRRGLERPSGPYLL